jgi:hypothetical protein
MWIMYYVLYSLNKEIYIWRTCISVGRQEHEWKITRRSLHSLLELDAKLKLNSVVGSDLKTTGK